MRLPQRLPQLAPTPRLAVGEPAAAGPLERLWRETQGDPRIRIAVLDGPVDRRHACFRDARLLDRGEPPRAGAGPRAAAEHGTHIASVIFGRAPVQGIAPGCTGLLFTVFGDRPDGGVEPCSQLDLARAITEAAELGAHVINVSGGQLASAPGGDLRLERAAQLCADLGILLVAAAGNDACDYELRNLGRAAPERALNFAATNAFQAAQVFSAALRAELQLDGIQVERSPLGRPGSECWDVKLGFFDPAQRLTRSRRVYRFTIDVSDVLPVTIGKVRSWDVF